MRASADVRWHAAYTQLIDRAHTCTGDELPVEVNRAIRPLGLAATLYLIDHEQRRLRPLPEPGRPVPAPMPVDEGPAGHAYTSVSVVPDGGAGGDRLWVAMVDGTERLGVVAVVATDAAGEDADDRTRRCVGLVGLIGHLVATKTRYGDSLVTARRSRPMTPAAELLLGLMPPLTFTCRRVVVSAVLEPAYECGGDAFDYSVDGVQAMLTVLDAMGRGLPAGLAAAVALTSLRAARRAGQPMDEMCRAADAALAEQFADLRFVTAVLADVDLDAGGVRYVNAGHPEPLLLRAGRAIGTLTGGRRLPLGIAEDHVDVAEQALEPGDRLLFYTDGVVEAPLADGQPLGLDRLVRLAEETAQARLPAPETLRRLTRAILARHDHPPRDDATLLLAEWPPRVPAPPRPTRTDREPSPPPTERTQP